jgi:hypothetical protein
MTEQYEVALTSRDDHTVPDLIPVYPMPIISLYRLYWGIVTGEFRQRSTFSFNGQIFFPSQSFWLA